MRQFNIHDTKTHLSSILEKVAGGETVIIAKAGKPVAKLMPIEAGEKPGSRYFGALRGQFLIPDDFDRMGEQEILDQFGLNE